MRILTVNTGSSSLKAALYDLTPEPALCFAATVEAIGTGDPRLRMRDAAGRPLLDRMQPVADHGAALGVFLDWLATQGEPGQFDAAGHRIVVGAAAFLAPRRLDEGALAELAALVPLAPDHLPPALSAIAALRQRHPALPQVTCSDSAFHRTLAPEARAIALPRPWRERGVARWGFHGLSCESALEALGRADPAAARGRLVVAHLGNGASLTAIRNGQSVDTTMGLTPTGGLLMSTRSGDLDPSIAVYLAAAGLDAAALNRLLNRESGLLGLSGLSSDMRQLLAARATHPDAALAIACFVWQAKKFLAAMAAALGGLDTLVFTGGIGERSAEIRAAICRDMAWMGLALDAGRNERATASTAAVVSPAGARTTVRILPADEDRIIARHAAVALELRKEPAHVSL